MRPPLVQLRVGTHGHYSDWLRNSTEAISAYERRDRVALPSKCLVSKDADAYKGIYWDL